MVAIPFRETRQDEVACWYAAEAGVERSHSVWRNVVRLAGAYTFQQNKRKRGAMKQRNCLLFIKISFKARFSRRKTGKSENGKAR